MVFDKVFWPENTRFFFTKSDPPGFLLLYVNLCCVHGLPALIANMVGQGAYLSVTLTEDEIIERG